MMKALWNTLMRYRILLITVVFTSDLLDYLSADGKWYHLLGAIAFGCAAILDLKNIHQQNDILRAQVDRLQKGEG